MPGYASIADLRARMDEQELIELSDDEASGAVNEGRVTRALEQADNLIDAYVAARFNRADATVPVPPLLTDLACDIARHRLFRRSEPTEIVVRAYKAAMTALTDIQAGRAVLDQGAPVIGARDGQILVDAPDRRFSRDSMAGY